MLILEELLIVIRYQEDIIDIIIKNISMTHTCSFVIHLNPYFIIETFANAIARYY